MECKRDQNKDNYCNCSYGCDKEGYCCECLHYHRKMGQLPACFFPEDIEKTYDRSFERFIQLYKERGRWW